MPQVILEFSSNILEKHGMDRLFNACHAELASSLPADLSHCKSRGIESDTYCIGDGSPNNAFVHMTLKIKAGRSLEVRNAIGPLLMNLLKAHFATSLQTLNLQITLEITELQPTYFSA